jgi:signal transduction histidine kinase
MSVSLSVIPPFWQTLWFQVFVVLLGGLVIFGYIRWRIYNLRKSKQKLKTLVGERTKEIEQVNQRLLKNQSLVNEQKDQISLQHEEIMKQNKIIQKQNDELKLANIQLEQTVKSRTKELRETNRELFASNHELDTFFYRAAHDLKGPVSTILGLTYLALKDGPDKQMHEYLRKMDDTAKRMSEILFNLQKINKIKHTNAEISEFRLMDVIHQALKDNIPDNEQIEQFINCDYYGVEDDTLILG